VAACLEIMCRVDTKTGLASLAWRNVAGIFGAFRPRAVAVGPDVRSVLDRVRVVDSNFSRFDFISWTHEGLCRLDTRGRIRVLREVLAVLDTNQT
jgi:hypothetical protein